MNAVPTCLTPWPGHYFHGFYNIQPWDASGRYVLAQRVPFADRMPSGTEPATLGLIDSHGHSFRPLDDTLAWNFQLGCLAHWLGDSPELLYNVRTTHGFGARLRDHRGGATKTFEQAIMTVSHDGRMAMGYNFARLQPYRPGYAYAGVPYPTAERLAPADEGLVRLDLPGGGRHLLVSYAQLAAECPHPLMAGNPVFISRVLFNADDSRIVLSFRFPEGGSGRWHTCLVTANPDGTERYLLADYDTKVAHFDWAGHDQLLAWTHYPGEPGACFHLLRDRSGDHAPFARGQLLVDGHCCWLADGPRVLVDTFPRPDGHQYLYLHDTPTGVTHTLAAIPSPKGVPTDLRCDLHPCPDRQGRSFSFDAMHEGRRAVYHLPLP